MKCAVIVAGGNSTRYGQNKLNEQLFDKTVLQNTVDIFTPICHQVVVVGAHIQGTTYAPAGQSRHQSVANGLNSVNKNCNLVAVHDGARPFVSRELVKTLFAHAQDFGSAVPRLPVTDTIWQTKVDVDESDLQKLNRDSLFTVQTPQVFCYKKLLSAFENAKYKNYTDESSLYFDTYGEIHFVQGSRQNTKVTFQGDLPTYKVGIGYDVHAFETGTFVLLGGVKIPFDKKLKGHSDADVLAHAISDAILSASNNRDIGMQFPDTDDKYLGADSLKLLGECVAIAKQSWYEVVNVSAVVICQQPKINPHVADMAQNLAKVLGISPTCVNLTATTTEGLGSLGNGDGIAVQATCLLKSIQNKL